MKKLLILPCCLLLASCASDFTDEESGSRSARLASNWSEDFDTPPEGHLFGNGDDGDLLDFKGLLDDEAWEAAEKRYEKPRSAPSPSRSSMASNQASPSKITPKRTSPVVAVIQRKPAPKTVSSPRPKVDSSPAPVRTTHAPPAVASASGVPSGIHLVAPGDTLYSLGKRYGVSPEAIRQQNQLPDNHIVIGRALRIPSLANRASGRSVVASPARQQSTTRPNSSPKQTSDSTHVVRSGDTLWRISQNYGVSIATIRSANGLNGDLVRPGDRLRIPRG